MTAKSTWFWIFVAAGLFALIYLLDKNRPPGNHGPARILPGLKAAEVTQIQVQPANGLEICVERTNQTWQLTRPLDYAAQSDKIEVFLRSLEELTAAAYITPAELRDRPDADEEYGFTSPLFTIIVQPGNYHLHLGLRTVPGDQIFLQVVGAGGIYVVDADFLKTIPATNDQWRSTTLIDLKALGFDRIYVTNAAAGFGLQRDNISHLWHILPPIEERADSAKIKAALQELQNLRTAEFVNDAPNKTDLENLGLASPLLELSFMQGTNVAAVLQFGKSPTNDAHSVYARRLGQSVAIRVLSDPLSVWREKADAFRDPHLIEMTMPITSIDVRGKDCFSLQRHSESEWKVLPQNFPADPQLVSELLSNLCESQATMVKGVVIPPDLGGYGLAPAMREYALGSAATNESGLPTNRLVAVLDFGTNSGDKVFARRTNESAVYSISLADFEHLPAESWQLREREIWNFSTNDVTALTIRQGKDVRRLLREGPYQWSLAPGSQGSINPLAIEEAMRAFTHLAADAWVARGELNRARFGLEAEPHRITLELKTGERQTVEFGAPAPSGSVYAAVKLDGESWIFQFPAWLYQFVPYCLSIGSP